jgi:ADP-heptose:LPS heptosyltransferase
VAVGRPARLLVLRALGLGDLLTGVPALRALADAFAGHERVVAMPAALAPLLDLAGTGFRVADHHGLDAALTGALAGADVAVNLHGRGPESHALLRAARPRRLVAFGGAVAWRSGEHEVDRWCRLLREHGIGADPSRLDLPPPAVAAPAPAVGATLVHPGAASPARRWPVERWAAVARAEREAGRSVVVTGGADERALAVELATRAGLPDTAVLAGRTSVLELAAAVAAAARVVCGDTGVAHLATAFGTPSVLLFGPTSPAEWGPPVARAQHRVLWTGRRGNPHAQEPDPGLLEIEVAAVVAALRDAAPEGVAA